MKITPNTIWSVLFFTFISTFTFGQDTLYVKLNNRRAPKVATRSIYLNNYRISSDTIYETKGSIMTRGQSLKLEELQSNNYFIFLDNKNRKIVACYWTMETLYGHLKYYYRNNQVKHEGDNFNGYSCGEWKYYTKTGILKKSKIYITCNKQ